MTAAHPDSWQHGPRSESPTRTARGDDRLLRTLWQKASSGVSAGRCEAEIPVDAFRIRRYHEHWLQEGALRPVEGPDHRPSGG